MATMAITVPLVAAGAAALKFAADFDASMTQSMAIMTEFGSKSELTAQGQAELRGEMEATARTVAKDLNLAAKDAAQSYFFLASAGMDAQQSMAALPQVALFAKAGMFDFAKATDLATDAQSALGLKAKDAQENLLGMTRVTDVLVKAGQLANASVEQFATSLTTKAGAALKGANKDIEEGVAVLAAFADQGIKAQDAGTALNIVMRDLSTKAIKNKEEFDKLGIAVFDSNDNWNNMADIVGDLEGALDGMSDAQKKATLMQLGFADKSVIFLQTLLGSSEAIREYETELRSAGGAAKEVAEDQLKAFWEQIGLVKVRVVDAAISVGSKLIPIVLDFVNAIEPLIGLLEDAAEWFANWPKPLQMAAVAFAGLVAAGGPLLMFIGFLTQSVAALIAIWPTLVTAFTFVTATAIPALVAAFHTVVAVIGPLLLPALAAVATAIAAYKITEWTMEWTGLRKVVDEVFTVWAKNLGLMQDGIPGSVQQTNILAKASRLAGEEITDWSKAMEIVNADLMEARERMERYSKKMNAATEETEALVVVTEKTAEELEALAREAEEAEKRLRDMVRTVAEAEEEARDLAAAVELEGGAMALTREETFRLAAMVKTWREENIDVAKSLEEVEKRAKALNFVEDLLNQEMEITSVRGGEVVSTLNEMAEKHQKNVDEIEDHNAYLEIYADDLRLAGEENEETTAKLEIFGQVMIEVAAVFEVFGISAESGIGRAIAAIAGLTASIPAILDFEKSILGSAASMSEKFAAGATAVAGGIAAIGTATAAGTTGQRAAGGAVAGAAAGAQIGGPIGAGVGAAVGALVGLFRGRAMDAAMREIETVVGMRVSEALGNAIRDAAKALDISVMGAAALSLGAVWAEAGGVAAVGLEPAKLALQTLIDFTVRGEVPLREGMASIGQAFGMMAEAAVEAGGVASSELFEVMEAAKRLGEEVPEIAAFITAQVAQAVEGVSKMGGLQIASQEDAQAQATIFSTTFFAAIEEMGLRAAVEALGPAFDVLKEKIQGFGEVDMGGMERFFEIARAPEFGPLLDGIQGLTETLAGAANAGFITTEMFNAIQHQGIAAFEQLTAAGLTETEALQQMAPLLQSMIDASNQYGMALDPVTAELIEQAEAAGIAFNSDPMYVVADALVLVATLLGATEEQLAGLGDTAVGTGDNLNQMGDTGKQAAEDIGAAGETSARDIEESYANLAEGFEGDFKFMGENAEEDLMLVASVAGKTVDEVSLIGDAAAAAADDFERMAEAARSAATAAASIPSPGGGGVTPMQHGGLITEPTLALLHKGELVIPAPDLSQATTREPAGIGDLDGTGRATTMNFDFSGAVVGDPNRLSQMIGEAVGIAIRNNEGDALTNAKEGLDTRA